MFIAGKHGFNGEIITKDAIVNALKELNVMKEEILIVYGDLSQSSYIVGGAQTVIEALYEVLGFHATVVMPAHSLNQDCPSFFDEDLPQDLLSVIKEHSPAFDKEVSAIASGDLAETFALNKNVVRSDHPVTSFLAMGQKAVWLMSNHELNSMFGECSPMQKLYAQGAKVLCLGVDYDAVTALHFMEYLASCREKTIHEAVIKENGQRILVEFEDLALNSSVFEEIGSRYEESKEILKTTIGSIECRLLDYQDFVDFGVKCLNE